MWQEQDWDSRSDHPEGDWQVCGDLQEQADWSLGVLWPVLAALLWQPYLHGMHTIFGKDDEVVIFGLFKGFSKHWDINAILAVFWTGVSISESAPWFERIASEDNPADALTKPGLSMEHLNGTIDDSGALRWDCVFKALGDLVGKQTLPAWPAAASFYAARFQ